MSPRATSKIRASSYHRSYKLNALAMQRFARDILRMIGKEGSVDIELIFVDDKSMRRYNRRYKSEDRDTDVLSFKIDRSEFGEGKPLGEIIVSLDTALRNSRIYATGFAEEAVLYVIHGMLHLFGYDDVCKRDSCRMAVKQKQILDRLCSKNLSKVLMPR